MTTTTFDTSNLVLNSNDANYMSIGSSNVQNFKVRRSLPYNDWVHTKIKFNPDVCVMNIDGQYYTYNIYFKDYPNLDSYNLTSKIVRDCSYLCNITHGSMDEVAYSYMMHIVNLNDVPIFKDNKNGRFIKLYSTVKLTMPFDIMVHIYFDMEF